MTRTITVVVVDDSAFMRKSLSMLLESDPQIKVIGTARDGKEGIEKINALHPDLVTMDIEMPGMDGLTALGIIMKESPLRCSWSARSQRTVRSRRLTLSTWAPWISFPRSCRMSRWTS